MTELDTSLPSLGAMSQHMVSSEGIRSDENEDTGHAHPHIQHHSHVSHPKSREPHRASIDHGVLKIKSKPSLGSLDVGSDEHIGKGIPMTTTTMSGKGTHRRPSHRASQSRPVLLHHLPRSSLYTPIPPSLLTSPLLNSPESPFFARSVCPLSSTSSHYPLVPMSSFPTVSSPATPTMTTPFQFPPISFLPPFSNNQQQLAFRSPHPPSPPASDDRSGQRRHSTEFIWPNSMFVHQTEPSQPLSQSQNHRQVQNLGA